MSVTVRLPREMGDRLVAEAARRGMSTDELVVELVDAGLSDDDPLEAFIGSIHSGRGDLGRGHRAIRAVSANAGRLALADDRPARDVRDATGD